MFFVDNQVIHVTDDMSLSQILAGKIQKYHIEYIIKYTPRPIMRFY